MKKKKNRPLTACLHQPFLLSFLSFIFARFHTYYRRKQRMLRFIHSYIHIVSFHFSVNSLSFALLILLLLLLVSFFHFSHSPLCLQRYSVPFRYNMYALYADVLSLKILRVDFVVIAAVGFITVFFSATILYILYNLIVSSAKHSVRLIEIIPCDYRWRIVSPRCLPFFSLSLSSLLHKQCLEFPVSVVSVRGYVLVYFGYYG